MRIDPEQRLAGYPILAIRDLLRKFVFDHVWVERHLKVNEAEAERIIEALRSGGWITHSKRHKSPNGTMWQTTPEGTRLANAEDREPIGRAEASRAIDALIRRIREVEADDRWLVRAGEALLFGSALTDAPEINDVDVIVKLEPKPRFSKSFNEAMKAKLDSLTAAGKTFANSRALATFLNAEVIAYLQAASPHLSFHRPDVLDLIEQADRERGVPDPGTPSKVIYKAKP